MACCLGIAFILTLAGCGRATLDQVEIAEPEGQVVGSEFCPRTSDPEVTPCAQALEPRPHHWGKVEVLQGGNELLIHLTESKHSLCSVLQRVEEHRKDDLLKLTIYFGWNTPAPSEGPRSCMLVGVDRITRFTLSSPVGNLRLVDGSEFPRRCPRRETSQSGDTWVRAETGSCDLATPPQN